MPEHGHRAGMAQHVVNLGTAFPECQPVRGLWASDRCRGARVGTGQPLFELAGRLVWCRAVERHQRGGHSRRLHDVRAPPIGIDRGHLDEVVAAGNGFFEAMNGYAHNEAAERFCCCGTRRILRFARRQSSEAPYETEVHTQSARELRLRKYFRCPAINRKFTLRPQVFHSLTRWKAPRTLGTS